MAKKHSYYIRLQGKRRDDGSLFVTCDDIPFFSAVASDWDGEVLSILTTSLEANNVGRVVEVRYVEDTSGLFDGEPTDDVIPPAHVLAEVERDRVGQHGSR